MAVRLFFAFPTALPTALADEPTAAAPASGSETPADQQPRMLGMAEEGTASPALIAALRKIQATSFPDAPLPMGVWFRTDAGFLFSYVDRSVGPSVAGEVVWAGDGGEATSIHLIKRTHTIGSLTHGRR